MPIYNPTSGGGGGGAGAFTGNVTTITVDTVATSDDDCLLANAAVIKVTLYTAVGNSGQVLFITNIHATGLVTIDGDGTETINGNLFHYLTVTQESVQLVSDGANWKIL